MHVSKRLQVLLDEAELRDIQKLARLRHMTVAEWVRQALRDARRVQPRTATARKLAVLRMAGGFSFPTADIDELNVQIASQYGIGEAGSPGEPAPKRRPRL